MLSHRQEIMFMNFACLTKKWDIAKLLQQRLSKNACFSLSLFLSFLYVHSWKTDWHKCQEQKQVGHPHILREGENERKKKSQKKAWPWPMCAVGQPFALISLPPSWFVVQQKRGIEISVEALRMEQHPIKWCTTFFIFIFRKIVIYCLFILKKFTISL